MSHNCPDCGKTCHCDGDDVESIPATCSHPCNTWETDEEGDCDILIDDDPEEPEYV